ncbi:MAG: peptidylprolyl isomerase [Campylobacterales bacterium]|nr:peptidylprolyl isomerase [Campylobacterales bacterium]
MTITKNTIVTLDCRLSDTSGNLLEESQELIYLHGGYGQVFAPLEEALEGKKIGDIFRVEIPAAQAFGEFDETLIVSESLDELPEDLEVGMEIDGYLEESPDDVIVYTVTDVSNGRATLDANHPLAGKDLVFEGSVAEIIEASEETVREILEHQHEH